MLLSLKQVKVVLTAKVVWAIAPGPAWRNEREFLEAKEMQIFVCCVFHRFQCTWQSCSRVNAVASEVYLN